MILRRVLIFIAITLVGTIAASAQASNIYISQSGSGALGATAPVLQSGSGIAAAHGPERQPPAA